MTPTQTAAKLEGEAEGRNARHPYAPFVDEIVQFIIQPRLVRLLQEHEFESKTELLKAFRKETNSSVSQALFDKWLGQLGIRFRKAMIVDGVKPRAPEPATTQPDAMALLQALAAALAGRPSGPAISPPVPFPPNGGLSSDALIQQAIGGSLKPPRRQKDPFAFDNEPAPPPPGTREGLDRDISIVALPPGSHEPAFGNPFPQ